MLKEYQDEVHQWASKFNPPYWPVSNQFQRLVEEIGEVARELNHLDGTKKKKADEKPSSLSDELADVMFTVMCMANSQGINLDTAFKEMMDKKIYKRDKDRFNQQGISK
jgi:NTP pyrophosphatase (non-canonical NTP hydrolase)